LGPKSGLIAEIGSKIRISSVPSGISLIKLEKNEKKIADSQNFAEYPSVGTYAYSAVGCQRQLDLVA
jgi:hypothetical protein